MTVDNLTLVHSLNVVGADMSAQLQTHWTDKPNIGSTGGGCGIK